MFLISKSDLPKRVRFNRPPSTSYLSYNTTRRMCLNPLPPSLLVDRPSICIHMSTYIYIHIHIYKDTDMKIYLTHNTTRRMKVPNKFHPSFIYMYIYIYTCIHLWHRKLYMYLWYTYTCIHIYVYVYIYIYIFICIPNP
jgi:hypothetical protein